MPKNEKSFKASSIMYARNIDNSGRPFHLYNNNNNNNNNNKMYDWKTGVIRGPPES